MLAVPLVATAGGTDWLWRRIPNWITVPGLFIGIAANAVVGGWPGAKSSLLGAGLGLALLLPFVLVRSMGGSPDGFANDAAVRTHLEKSAHFAQEITEDSYYSACFSSHPQRQEWDSKIVARIVWRRKIIPRHSGGRQEVRWRHEQFGSLFWGEVLCGFTHSDGAYTFGRARCP